MSTALVILPSTAPVILPKLWACAYAPKPNLMPVPRRPRAKYKTKPKPQPKPKPVEPVLAFYRKYTEGMLRRYMRFSMEAGRVPSMLGREMFRGKVTSYQVHGFDDLVIFAHDVENCIAKLRPMEQLLLTKIAIQEYTHQEVATMFRVPRRSVFRRYEEAIDRLTGIFLELELLEPRKECQGVGSSRYCRTLLESTVYSN